MKQRTRTCTNPAPSGGGALCSGLEMETGVCDGNLNLFLHLFHQIILIIFIFPKMRSFDAYQTLMVGEQC